MYQYFESNAKIFSTFLLMAFVIEVWAIIVAEKMLVCKKRKKKFQKNDQNGKEPTGQVVVRMPNICVIYNEE